MKRSDHQVELSRRNFVKVSVASAAAAGISRPARAQEEKEAETRERPALPRRVLGRTGEKVTILNLGAGRALDARMLNATYDLGIRCLDTAANYANGESERSIGQWFESTGRRKEIFIVTKHVSKSVEEWVEAVDERLEALKTDYIDLYFAHGLGEPQRKVRFGDDGMEWPKMKEWAAAADKLKKSGKVRFTGFSTHSEIPIRAALMNHAVEGGWTDAIMISYDPQSARESAEFAKALDACHQAGIGLITMKQMRAVGDVPKFLPQFKEMGLSTHQAVLHGVWSDERITTICTDMPNLRILKQNADAGRAFKKPLDDKKLSAVLDLYRRYPRRFCNACDGSCRRAGKTKAALNELARALSYCEDDGRWEAARELYASLTPEQRRWHDADLAAASQACVCKLDFAAILPRVDRKLA